MLVFDFVANWVGFWRLLVFVANWVDFVPRLDVGDFVANWVDFVARLDVGISLLIGWILFLDGFCSEIRCW
jgi:hypothetical protein